MVFAFRLILTIIYNHISQRGLGEWLDDKSAVDIRLQLLWEERKIRKVRLSVHNEKQDYNVLIILWKWSTFQRMYYRMLPGVLNTRLYFHH